jgi:hypothetical protein
MILGEVIRLFGATDKSHDNLIISAPFEFRRADWETAHFVQMLRVHTAQFEAARLNKTPTEDSKKIHLPPHFELTGGLFNTIVSLFSHREDEEAMRDIYYLTGLTDCIINQVNPVLRTDLLRDMYRRIFKMKEKLKVSWYGRPLDKVLLPIEGSLFSHSIYRESIGSASTMKEIYAAIRKGTGEMFDTLSANYVFYCPSSGGVPRLGA